MTVHPEPHADAPAAEGSADEVVRAPAGEQHPLPRHTEPAETASDDDWWSRVADEHRPEE